MKNETVDIAIITPEDSPLLKGIERVIRFPFGWEIAIRRRVKTKHEWVQPYQMRITSVSQTGATLQDNPVGQPAEDPVQAKKIKSTQLLQD